MATTPDILDPRLLQLRQPPQPLPIANGAPQQPQPSSATLPRAAGQTSTIPLTAFGQEPIPRMPVAQPTANQAELARLTAPPPADRSLTHTRANTGAPGSQQIHNPLLRTLATIGDVASTFFPGPAMAVPGTTLHHQMLLRNAGNAVKGEEEQQNAATRRGLEEAQTEEARAKANPAAKTATNEMERFFQQNPEATVGDWRKFQVENPEKTTKEGGTVHQDAEGNYWVIHPDGSATAVTAKGDQIKGKTAEDKGGTVHEDAEGNMWVVKPDGTATPVRPKAAEGAPAAAGQLKGKVPTKTENAEQQFIDEYQKTHAGASVAQAQRAYKVNEQLPPQRDPDVALDRESTRFAKSHEKAVSDANAQLEKIADARAMINGSAEAQALGIPKVLTALVSGQGSGVRITQPELNAIGTARGIGGSVEGFLNSISGKGKLTATQQQQLTQILDDVKTRIAQKQAIANDALDKINSARSREEIINVDKTARKTLTDMEKGATTQSAGQMIRARDPQGKLHEAPAGTPLPSGWKAEK